MRKQKKQLFPCIYCASTENPTKDHIPPKNLFAKPRPNNLITVPSCKSCNEGFQLDDDYLHMVMQTYIKTSEHPELLKTKEKFIRSVHRKESAGFRQSILKNSTWREIYSKSGIYLGDGVVQDVDWSRIENVVRRVVKGLFFREKGFLLPSKYIAKVQAIATQTREEMEIVENTLNLLAAQNEIIIGNNVFSYRFIFYEEDIYQTAWLLVFYEQLSFLGLTLAE